MPILDAKRWSWEDEAAMARRALVLALVAFGWLCAERSARAGIFEVYGQVNAGGGFGRGNAAAPSKDFFEAVQGAAVGGELGIEVMFIDLFVDHDEFFTDRIKGSWTQFMIGFDADFPMDDEHTTQGTVGVDAGLGVGTLQSSLFSEPPPPISRKGATAELRLQGDRLLGKYAAIGLDLRLGWHYLFDQDKAINAPDAFSQGIHLFGGLAFKVHFGIN